MADKKVTDLTAITSVSGDDLLLVVDNPNGTPASRKITVDNFLGDTTVDQVHHGKATFRANTNFVGTKVTFSANVEVDGTNIMSAIDDRVQVANMISFATGYPSNNDFQSYVANTNLAVSDRMQVANVNALFVDPVTSGNVVFDRLIGNRLYSLIVPIDPSGPQTSNAALETTFDNFTAIPQGTVWFANSHIYVATTPNDIKKTRISHEEAQVFFSMRDTMDEGIMKFTTVGGGASGEPNEPLTLYKGFTYEFRTTTAGHDLEIRLSDGGEPFANGIVQTNVDQTYFTVPQNLSSNLVYQCIQHPTMIGTLVIK